MNVLVTLLGGVRIQVDGQSVPLKGQKPQALLIWLALHLGQATPRDHIARLLWPHAEPENARVSLRQALTALRRVLPDVAISSEGQDLQLDAALCQVDAVDFLRSVHGSDIAVLQKAADRYSGELCAGFLSQVDGFDEWLSSERQRVRRAALKTMQTLTDHHLETGELSAAIGVALNLLTIDPLQEHVHRQVMTLYAQLGEKGSAVRQYELCREALARDLDSPPEPETVALFNAIRRGEINNIAKTAPAAPQTDRSARLPSIAVLPFISMSADIEHEFLADGMTEELINLLAQSVNWRVISRNSSFRYKGEHVDVREVGEQLGVGYVVEGSVRRVADRIRVTAQLVSTEDGAHIWSDRYDCPLSEIFEVQDEVVHAIFRVLKNRLGFAERERVRRTQRANLDAWGLLIKANQISVRDKDTREEQRALVREALSIDPDYARAHALMASILFLAVARGYSSDRKGDFRLANVHIEKALVNGESDPVVLAMGAGGLAAVGQSERAMRLAQRTYEISGNVKPLYVAVLMWNGRLDEAKTHAQQLLDNLPEGVSSTPGELRPVSLLGNVLMLQGDYEGALALAERDLTENPGNYFSYVNLANLYGYLNRADEAKEKWDRAVELMPRLSMDQFQRGYVAVCTDDDLAARFSAGLLKAGIE